MASALGAAATIFIVPRRSVEAINGLSRKNFPSIRTQPTPLRFRVSCAAKKETLDKVCEIMKKHLALPGHAIVTGNSKFSELGVDSLDTVEIAMGFEDAFGISLEEERVQSIQTVQDAAEMIEELLSES